MKTRERQLLDLLERHEELSLGLIADLLGMSRSQASRLANDLVKDGLVARRDSADDLRFVLFSLAKEKLPS